MSRTITFWLYSYNMKCNPVQRPKNVTDEMQMVNRLFGNRSVGGIQENYAVPWYKSIPKKILKHKFSLSLMRYNTPIVYGNKWEVTSSYFIKCVSAVRHFTPTRGVSVALAKRNGVEICEINQHPINRGGHLRKTARQTKKRNELRQHQWEEAQREAMRWYLLEYPVFITGDFNDATVVKYHDRQVWLYQNGIDKIGAIVPEGYSLEVLGRRHIPSEQGRNHSDHDLIAVHVKLTKI